MFFPIGDSPNPPGFRAWVTWLLIVINVAIFLVITLPLSSLTPDPADPALRGYVEVLLPNLPSGTSLKQLMGALSQYDLFVYAHGFKPATPALADMFSAMFLHAGFGHLAGNMLFLWIYGDNVEHRLGRFFYLLAYLGTGVAATLGFAMLSPGSKVPMIGASGAISGVLGFYFLFFPRNEVRVAVLFFPFVMRVYNVGARWVLGAFVVIDNLLPMLFSRGSRVAYGAHLGGFLAGVAAAAVINLFTTRAALGDEPRATDAQNRARQSLLVGIRLLKHAQPAAAWHHLMRAAEEGDEDTVARAKLLMAKIRAGDRDDA